MNAPKKAWTFTLNNYTPEEEQQLKDLECSYIVFGHEVGAEGTPHLQGHVVFRRGYRLTGLKKLNDRVHWEPSISDFQSSNYCMKDKDYFLKDNRIQGQRNDIINAINCLKVNNNINDVKSEYPAVYVKFHNGLEKLINQPKRNFKPEVTWIWGASGVGKTRHVVDREKSLWISGKNLQWWQGYNHEEATLFDDFRGDFCTYHELLRILDRYPHTVEVKGGSRELNSKRMYITSCYPPDKVYNTIEDKYQLLRRIDNIIEM